MNKFPANVCEKLNHYVYIYIDPRNNEIFYVGKGKNNRVFSHPNDTTENDKTKRIQELKNANLEPIIEILIHGINTDEAVQRIETSIIDLIGIKNLTNIQRGYKSKEYGRMTIDQILSYYNSEKVQINEPVILININKTYKYGISDIELYDATRSAWVVNDNRERAKYALSIYQGIVKEVYEIKGWYLNNSTFNTRKNEELDLETNRYEIGRAHV